MSFAVDDHGFLKGSHLLRIPEGWVVLMMSGLIEVD